MLSHGRIIFSGKIIFLSVCLFSGNLSADQRARYSFDNAALFGNADNNDMKKFNVASMLPGKYSVDIYINNYWRGRHELVFTLDPDGKLVSCYTPAFLNRLGLNTDVINKTFAREPQNCHSLAEWAAGQPAQETVSNSDLSLRLTVPQAWSNQLEEDYVQPDQWQPGVPALNIGYSADYYSTQERLHGRTSEDYAWAGLEMRGSANGWLLEHLGNLNWDSDQGKHYTSNRTTLKRPLINHKSMLSLGQYYSNSSMFDAMTIMGVNLETHDLMQPDSALNWGPVIRGIAETNARVTVTQDGRILHQTTVPAGPFAIDSLLPAETGSDVLVTIQEADGRIRRFSVPYASIAQLMRPGVSHYSLSVGKIDENSRDEDPFIAQATWQHGLNNTVTLYTGATGFTHYQAAVAGGGFNTAIGALALDITQSRFNYDSELREGQSYRLTYNRTLPLVRTSLWLEARQNTKGYYAQRDAYDETDKHNTWTTLRDKQSLSGTLNQPLPGNWGTIYLSGSLKKYQDQSDKYRQYSAGYSNSWRNISWSLSAQRFWNEDDNGNVIKDDQITFTLSYFLNHSRGGYTHINSDSYSNNGRASATRLGFTHSPDEENNITWGMDSAWRRGGEVEWGANGNWRTPYTTLRGTWSQSNYWHQAGAGLNGTLVAHRNGITTSPEQGDTLALINAPGAVGARLSGVNGTRFDSNGYAIIPWLRPWRINDIAIDPAGAPDDIRFERTMVSVAPYEGNVVAVTMKTQKTNQQILRIAGRDASRLPFGASVTDEKNNHIGYVGQGGMLYIDDTPSARVFVISGNEKCTITLKRQEAVCH